MNEQTPRVRKISTSYCNYVAGEGTSIKDKERG